MSDSVFIVDRKETDERGQTWWTEKYEPGVYLWQETLSPSCQHLGQLSYNSVRLPEET